VTDIFNLTGTAAIVTGANTGIGQAVALALAGAGADVALAGRTPAVETAAKVEALGRRAVTIDADLGSTEPVRRIVDQCLFGLGRLDILVNNAGIIRRADAVDFSEADWDAVVDTDLKSLFFLCQAAGRHMIGQGRGKIVNIASLLSFQGGIRVPSYAAAKSGVAGLTKALANEWADRGVNVNAVAPGYVATANTHDLRLDAERSDAILARIPAARWAEPSDIAGAVLFLCSRAADYIHGAVLPVDGGWLAR